MQTKRQIQQLLASADISPNKRLGQHFLVDLNLMRLLVSSAGITGGDVVLEVGCGTGSLTEALAEVACRVVAVEVDRGLAVIAKRQLEEHGNVEIINSDVLANKSTIHPAVTSALEQAGRKCGGRTLLVGNLPYNVASPLMIDLVVGPVVVDGMFVTVQKEVAERMTALPGSREYGSLGIFFGATGDAEVMRLLKPSVFWPQPQVDSAMVSFVRRPDKTGRIANMGVFGEIVSLFMRHRRKTVRACTRFASGRLAGVESWAEVFKVCSVDAGSRPQQLSPQDYVSMANACRRLTGQRDL